MRAWTVFLKWGPAHRLWFDQRSITPVLACVVKKFYKGSFRNCSDHYPVQMIFEFLPEHSPRRKLTEQQLTEEDPYYQAIVRSFWAKGLGASMGSLSGATGSGEQTGIGEGFPGEKLTFPHGSKG